MAVDVADVDGWADCFHRSASTNNNSPPLHDVDRSLELGQWLRRWRGSSVESGAKSPVLVPGTGNPTNSNHRYAAVLLPINNFNLLHHHHRTPYNLGLSLPPPSASNSRVARGTAPPLPPYGAAISSNNMDFVKDSYEHVTSPAAKRTYLRTFLVLTTSLVLLGIAALAYPVFYYNYIPKKVVSIPVHLQYNAGLNPYGIAHLSSQLATEQAYDVTVELTLPRSPTNVERGNFMVALYALKSQPENPAFAFGVPSLSALSDPYAHVTPNSVVFSSRRPALLPYRDPLVSRASRLLFLPYHILFPAAEATTTLSIPMGELVEFVGGSGSGRQQLPLSVLVDVQAGQALQVYSASVTLVARLSGLRWAMYNHRVISFTVGTTAFWIAEMLSMGAAWLLIAQCFSGGHREEFDGNRAGRLRGMAPSSRGELPGGDLSGVKQDEEEDDDVKIKEESTEQETLVGDLPRHGGGGDADDEEDGDDIWKESRSGTSGFHDGKGGSIRRRSSRGSIRS